MATVTFSKKRFIQFLEQQLDEDDIILMTKDLEGSISVAKKRNVKKITFGFAADAFKQEGVGHIFYGKTPMVAFSICKNTDVSDHVIQMKKESDEKFLTH